MYYIHIKFILYDDFFFKLKIKNKTNEKTRIEDCVPYVWEHVQNVSDSGKTTKYSSLSHIFTLERVRVRGISDTDTKGQRCFRAPKLLPTDVGHVFLNHTWMDNVRASKVAEQIIVFGIIVEPSWSSVKNLNQLRRHNPVHPPHVIPT